MVGYFSLGDIANEFIPAVEIPAVGVVFPTTVVGHEGLEKNFIRQLEKKILGTGDVDKIEITLDRDKNDSIYFL